MIFGLDIMMITGILRDFIKSLCFIPLYRGDAPADVTEWVARLVINELMCGTDPESHSREIGGESDDMESRDYPNSTWTPHHTTPRHDSVSVPWRVSIQLFSFFLLMET